MKTTEGEQDEVHVLEDKLTCVCHLVLCVRGRQRKPCEWAQRMCKKAPKGRGNTRDVRRTPSTGREEQCMTHTCAHTHTHTGMKGKCSKKLGLMTRMAQSTQGQEVTGGSGAVFKR